MTKSLTTAAVGAGLCLLGALLKLGHLATAVIVGVGLAAYCYAVCHKSQCEK